MTALSLCLLVWLAAAFPPAGMLAQSSAGTKRVEEILIRGAEGVPAQTIRLRIRTTTGGTYTASSIAADVRAVYELGAFEDVWVEEEAAASGGIALVFNVRERRRIRAIHYEGLSSITQSEVLKTLAENKIHIGPGKYEDAARLQKAAAAIKALLSAAGRSRADVAIVREPVEPRQSSITFRVAEGPKAVVGTIDFEGNSAFSDSELRRAMQWIHEGGWRTALTNRGAYDDGKLDIDRNNVRAFYAEHGYARANVLPPKVEERPERIMRTLPFIQPPFPWGLPIPFWRRTVERVHISMDVEENSRYRFGTIRLNGATQFSVDTLKTALGLKEDGIYDETALKKGLDNLKRLYGDRGFLNFTPSPKQEFDDARNLVHLDIGIHEDRAFRVGRIRITGNDVTRDKVIRREFRLLEGAAFNTSAWARSTERLNRLGYFEVIRDEDARVEPAARDGDLNLTLKVKERPRSAFDFNGGISDSSGGFVGFHYETTNFLGFGETLKLNLQGGSRRKSAVFSFNEPYFLDRPLGVGFTVFHDIYNYDDARGVYATGAAAQLFESGRRYAIGRSGFGVYGTYPVGPFHAGLTYQFEDSTTRSVDSAIQNYFSRVVTHEGPEAAGGSLSKIRKIVPNLSFSSVDTPWFPSRGQEFSATVEYAGGVLGGNTNFFRPAIEYKRYQSHTRNGNVFAIRLSGSYVHGFSGTSVPFNERFYTGGEEDVRGFDYGTLGPLALAEDSVSRIDPESGQTQAVFSQSIVPVGGDARALFTMEYRIPVGGPAVTLTPFFDAGNAWAVDSNQLRRRFLDAGGANREESVRFLAGTNSGIRTSTGLEVGILLPVIRAPIRLIFAWNPQRLDRSYELRSGQPFFLRDDKTAFKVTFGKTF